MLNVTKAGLYLDQGISLSILLPGWINHAVRTVLPEQLL